MDTIDRLLTALKPFYKSAIGVNWKHTPDRLEFFPVNSLLEGVPITMGALRHAMNVYEDIEKDRHQYECPECEFWSEYNYCADCGRPISKEDA